MKRNFIIACISALTLTSVSCSEVKKTDIQPENNTVTPESSATDSVTSESEETENVAHDNKKEDIVITMAINSNMRAELQDEIDSFNSADNGYQIVTKSYDMDFYDEEINSVVLDEGDDLTIDFNITQDIIHTTDIDIIASSAFGNASKFEILKNMGAFADLYSFMENDPEVNTSTLNQHILSLNETDGELRSLPMYYMVDTLFGETKYVGDKENWTVDDFISHWEQMPEGSTVNGSRNSENIYYDILRNNLESFVDYENVKVNFDCPEFRKILEFCNRFESNNGQKTEWDYESPRMVSYTFIGGIMASKLFGENGDEVTGYLNAPFTMVGYPSADGQGAFFSNINSMYSISANSSPEKQQGAWEFIRQFYTEEYQLNNVREKYIDDIEGEEYVHYSSECGLCINNNAFDAVAQKTINCEYDDGKRKDKDVEYTISMPTQEEIDKMKKYLDRWETTLDRELWKIIEDEVMAYFAGEKSLDDTVNLIQDRASIWISEQC